VGAFTSRFSLYKPGGGSTGLIVPDEILDIDKLNSNFDIIDANLGAFIATSTTLPGVPKVGQLVFETDTKRLRIYSGGSFVAPATERGSLTMYTGTNLAALDAISDGVIGDSFYMTDPGLGNSGTGTIDSNVWVSTSGAGAALKWRPQGPIIADTKAHMDTFIAAVAALTDLRFEVGGQWVDATTGFNYRFTSTVGAYLPLNNIVAPTAVSSAGTSATLNVDGSITCVALTALTLDGLFSVARGDHYRVVLIGDASTAIGGTVALRAAGATISAANYEYLQHYFTNGATTPAAPVAGATSMVLSVNSTGTRVKHELLIFNPAQPKPTMLHNEFYGAVTPYTTTNQIQGVVDGVYDANTVVDGITISFNGTFTGTVRIGLI
jgi:hypothetical protein